MKTLTIHLDDATYAKLAAEAAFNRRARPEDQLPFTLAAHYGVSLKFDPRKPQPKTTPTAVSELLSS